MVDLDEAPDGDIGPLVRRRPRRDSHGSSDPALELRSRTRWLDPRPSHPRIIPDRGWEARPIEVPAAVELGSTDAEPGFCSRCFARPPHLAVRIPEEEQRWPQATVLWRKTTRRRIRQRMSPTKMHSALHDKDGQTMASTARRRPRWRSSTVKASSASAGWTNRPGRMAQAGLVPHSGSARRADPTTGLPTTSEMAARARPVAEALAEA